MTPAALYQATLAEQDRARRALRGEAAYVAAGYSASAAQAAALTATPAGAGSDEPLHTAISVNGAGSYTLIPGAMGSRIQVFELVLYLEQSQTWELWNGVKTLTGPMVAYPAASGFALSLKDSPHWKLDAGAGLRLTLSGAGQASGFILYKQG